VTTMTKGEVMKLIMRFLGTILMCIGLYILMYMGPGSKHPMTNYLLMGGFTLYAGVRSILENQD